MCKWLPIFFGCHGRPERSFKIKGEPMPICARCTGELIGMIFAIPLFIFVDFPPIWGYALLAIPMLIDGFVQAFTKYESNNLKRVVTGFLFGIFLYATIAGVHVFAFELGQTHALQRIT